MQYIIQIVVPQSPADISLCRVDKNPLVLGFGTFGPGALTPIAGFLGREIQQSFVSKQSFQDCLYLKSLTQKAEGPQEAITPSYTRKI